MDDNDFNRIEEMLKHQIGIMSEHFQHKLDFVVEGHQMLSEKLDRVETRLDARIDCIEHKLDGVAAKLDGVAADLTAHRKDTEAHGPIFRVKE